MRVCVQTLTFLNLNLRILGYVSKMGMDTRASPKHLYIKIYTKYCIVLSDNTS